MPNIKLSHEIWFWDSWGHFLGWKMPKMVKFGKIEFQISGQWSELGASYFEVKIPLPMDPIGESVAGACQIWLTLIWREPKAPWTLKAVSCVHQLPLLHFSERESWCCIHGWTIVPCTCRERREWERVFGLLHDDVGPSFLWLVWVTPHILFMPL